MDKVTFFNALDALSSMMDDVHYILEGIENAQDRYYYLFEEMDAIGDVESDATLAEMMEWMEVMKLPYIFDKFLRLDGLINKAYSTIKEQLKKA